MLCGEQALQAQLFDLKGLIPGALRTLPDRPPRPAGGSVCFIPEPNFKTLSILKPYIKPYMPVMLHSGESTNVNPNYQ